jgi:hypothetical protein
LCEITVSQFVCVSDVQQPRSSAAVEAAGAMLKPNRCCFHRNFRDRERCRRENILPSRLAIIAIQYLPIAVRVEEFAQLWRQHQRVKEYTYSRRSFTCP